MPSLVVSQECLMPYLLDGTAALRSHQKEIYGYYAFAYVWNKDDDFCSEFGTIGLKSFGGGIKRIG